MTNSGLTTELPKWLMMLTGLTLVLRVAVTTFEIEHPPAPKAQVMWRAVFDTLNPEPQSGKLRLYYFMAGWCGSCKKLEVDSFENTDIVAFINANFLPIKVLDRSLEERVNPPQVQALEDKLLSHDLKIFPCLVVTLSDGTKISSLIGVNSCYHVGTFLRQSMKTADVVLGRRLLTQGQCEQAAMHFDSALKAEGWSHEESGHVALLKYLALKESGDGVLAQEVLKQARDNLNPQAWPYPIFRYLSGQLSYQSLKNDTGDSAARRVLMHTVVGLEYFCNGQIKESLEHLNWTHSQTDFKTWTEYELCEIALNKIGKLPPPALNADKAGAREKQLK